MTIEGPPATPEPVKRTAIRWLHNGDHPADHVGEQLTNEIGETYRRLEGAVVRFFRHPDLPGDQEHNGPDGCWKRWHDHGWIDEGEDGLTVCPGDLVVDLPDGTHEVLKLGRGAYRDRNDHYVPAGLHLGGKERYVEVSEGSRGRSAETLEVYMASAAMVIRGLLDLLDGGDGGVAPGGDIVHAARQWLKTMAEPQEWERARPPRLARVAMAMPDELNRDQGDWWWADLSADGEPGTHWSAFRGHRVQVDVELHTSNGREVNDWKGRDEIRAGGEWSIKLNRQAIDGGYVGMDVPATLRKIANRVDALTGDGIGGCPGLDLTDPTPFAQQLVGRRVYYREVPAVITSTVLDQGCVILRPVGRSAFPRPAHDLDSEPDGTGHDEQDLYDEHEAREAKVEIDSPHIWWWRNRPFSPDEPDGRYRPKSKEMTMQTNEQETPESTEAPEVVEINPASGNPVPEDMRTRQGSRWKPVGSRWKPVGTLTTGETVYAAPLDAEVDEPSVFEPLPPVDETAAEQARESVPVEADDDTEDEAR